MVAGFPEIKWLEADGFHPTPGGAYLIACVFYADLLNRNPEGLPVALRHPNARGGDVEGVLPFPSLEVGQKVKARVWTALQKWRGSEKK